MARCVPMDVPGWDGPFLVFTTNIDAPAACPMLEEPEWTAYAEVEPAECDCQCGEAEADCIVDFTVGPAGACSDDEFQATNAGVCQVHNSANNSDLSLEAENLQALNPTSANPDPPLPTFASVVTACGLPSGDGCTDGTCIELLPPNPQVCITRPGAAGEQCPAGFDVRRVVAAAVSSDGLDCEACGCTATDVTCGGQFRFFEDADCLDQFGAPLPLVDSSCDGAGVALDDVAGIRLDADVTGTISATGAPKGIAPAGGIPALEAPRTLCCL